jgi:hypothetical protein
VSRAQEWSGVHRVTGSVRTTLLRDWERRRGLGDGACVIDGITSSGQGRWRRVKGLDHDREGQHGGSEEDSTTAWAPGRSRRCVLQGNF